MTIFSGDENCLNVFHLDDLESNTDYYVQIRSRPVFEDNSGNWSADGYWSDTVFAQTKTCESGKYFQCYYYCYYYCADFSLHSLGIQFILLENLTLIANCLYNVISVPSMAPSVVAGSFEWINSSIVQVFIKVCSA